MRAIVEFLKVLGHLLRSGKMSYGDALTRFRAQFGRPAEGMEKVAIMKEVEKAPSNVIDFPKDRITDWWKPRPGSGKKEGIAGIEQQMGNIKGLSDELAKKSADVHPFQGFTPKIVPNKRAEFLKKYTKDGQPNDVELNALVNEHRILSEEAKKLGDAGENYEKFSQLNKRTDEIEEIIEFMRKEFPEGMASGGIARVGMAGGGALWKLIQEFIEKLFIKTSNDIRLGKGKWAGLNQEQWIKQHDDLTKMLKKWEMGGKKRLPEGASEYLGMNDLQIARAVKEAGKKVDKDRLATADELEEYESILDPTGVTGDVGEGMTVKELDKMVADHKAYVDDMYQQYKRGDLEKYVKPEVREASRLSYQKKIDNVLDKAYDEVFYQKPVTGDHKYDADVLSDSIAEQLGKVYDDLPVMHQSQIHNTALKRVTQDMQMKKLLSDVDESMTRQALHQWTPGKGRKPNASGGIAGQLHLNEGGRVPMIFGGSAGLRALIKRLRGGEKTLFPKPSRKHTEFGKLTIPKTTESIESLNLQQLENLLEALKIDKQAIKQIEANKQMKDPGLDFLMGEMRKDKSWGLDMEQLGKYIDIDKDIMAVEQILKNKMMKGRKPNAEGGIAGQLHLNRPGYARGGRQPGLETSTSRAKQEAQQQDIRNLQQTMADRGGGDAQAYVRQHELSQTPDRTMGLGALIKKTPKRPRRPRPPPWKRLPPPSIFRDMFYEPPSKKIYQTEEDIPEGVLELLKKDPNFNLEDFLDMTWTDPGYRWTDTNPRTQGLRGSYSGMTGDITLGMAPFGQKEYVKWFPDNPHAPEVALRDMDKAKIASHELRHKNIIENPELFASQPDWVQKNMWGIDYSVEPDEEGPYPFAENLPKDYQTPYMTGHELYNRYLDQTFYPPEERPGKSEPYFDKILSDLWQPSAEEYKRISQLNKDPMRKTVLYKAGGLAHVLGV